MKKIRLIFPWATVFLALLLILYLYSETAPWPELSLPAEYYEKNLKHLAFFLFICLFIFEMTNFRRKQKQHNQAIEKYISQVNQILKTKNALQEKAHKYSDHADKLKLFISDRLLEYIEYDEKFLHFKNIASEVRHNGVVCYDKVNSALNHANKENKNRSYDDALHSMRYLWDLLDLSTTDNIALYIANKLYEAEEQYYQSLLENKKDSPFTPVFPAQRAIYKALHGFANQADKPLPALEKNNKTYLYQDNTYWVSIENSGELLGNENYIVLMAENIINNALYYVSNKRYANKHARIEIKLSQKDGQALFTLYNHGPNIDEAIKQQIFQLGYSTKRIKENNGKGLGLYFVNEIVKGYEGRVCVDNVHNQADTYVIRISLANGESISHIVETRLDEKNKLLCKNTQTDTLSKTLAFQTRTKTTAIEVAVQSQQKTYVVDNEKQFTDPYKPARPQWCLDILHKKDSSKITFKPLNITGVLFSIQLPTAASRLDATYHDSHTESSTDISVLSDDFAELEPFVK